MISKLVIKVNHISLASRMSLITYKIFIHFYTRWRWHIGTKESLTLLNPWYVNISYLKRLAFFFNLPYYAKIKNFRSSLEKFLHLHCFAVSLLVAQQDKFKTLYVIAEPVISAYLSFTRQDIVDRVVIQNMHL